MNRAPSYYSRWTEAGQIVKTPVSSRTRTLRQQVTYWISLNIVTLLVFCVKLGAWDFQQGKQGLRGTGAASHARGESACERPEPVGSSTPGGRAPAVGE